MASPDPTPSPRATVSERALLRVGTVIGKYRIARLLGVGGMGTVYAGEHRNGHRVAIKFLQERYLDDPELTRLFRREGYLANQVEHPGAVPVMDDDEDDAGCPFLVMPLLTGETIRARWERAGKRLPLDEVGVLVSDALDVLATAHEKGIVHRDVKPENLFIDAQGRLRVLDFGIARWVDTASGAAATGTGTGHAIIGTPGFMPPEQALGNREAIGPHSDVWAMGATMFTLLSGEPVHPAEHPGAQLVAAATRPPRSLGDVMPRVAQPIVRVVDKALAFDPVDRWPHARAMHTALFEALEQAMSKPLSEIAAPLRASLSTDLSAQAGETHRTWDPATIRRIVRTPDAGVEIRATPLFRAFRLIPTIAYRILAKHGLGRFGADGKFIPDPRAWWPREPFMATVWEIAKVVGPAKMMDIGRLRVHHMTHPPGVQDLRSMLQMIDIGYHLDHRLHGKLAFDFATGQMTDGIGHVQCLGEIAPRRMVVACTTPYPCAHDHGVGIGISRMFEPGANVEHVPGECRNDGAERCVYHVIW